MRELIEKVLSECKKYTADGRVADYIPELKKACPADLGICVLGGSETVELGDCDKRFTMQSVVKPMILLLALMDNGRETVERLCGVEATGKPFDAFNYSDMALRGEHINPMVNAGAIALCTLIGGEGKDEKFERLFSLVKRLSKNQSITVDEAVFRSERETGNKNRALAYMLKAYGMIDCDVEDMLEVYFKACSISVSCKDIANIALVLAHRGRDPESGEELIPAEYSRYVTAILAICGMYDGSGEFALRVGIPAKSGVGGGIMAVVPGKMGIGIYSPSLDKKGNSTAGVKVLERLSAALDLSIF
ncbi:MAG: glutaminase A [Clostridia bacterium]|nr:glutaminase A [Clostridia bacterium]